MNYVVSLTLFSSIQYTVTYTYGQCHEMTKLTLRYQGKYRSASMLHILGAHIHNIQTLAYFQLTWNPIPSLMPNSTTIDKMGLTPIIKT